MFNNLFNALRTCRPNTTGSIFAVCIGVGVALGVAMDNIAVGVALGVAVGVVLGRRSA